MWFSIFAGVLWELEVIWGFSDRGLKMLFSVCVNPLLAQFFFEEEDKWLCLSHNHGVFTKLAHCPLRCSQRPGGLQSPLSAYHFNFSRLLGFYHMTAATRHVTPWRLSSRSMMQPCAFVQVSVQVHRRHERWAPTTGRPLCPLAISVPCLSPASVGCVMIWEIAIALCLLSLSAITGPRCQKVKCTE